METVRSGEHAPRGWPAALVMFHIAMWRERLRDSFRASIEGVDYRLPGNPQEINDAELPNGIGTPLADAAARAEHLLSELIELYERMGDRKFNWLAQVSAAEAVLRNSYSHARRHMHDYFSENDELDKAHAIVEAGLRELRELEASDYVLGYLTEVE